MRVLVRGRARWAALIAIVAVLAVGGIAYAMIPDANGVIHSCYKKSGGALRVIDSAVTNCDVNETPLNWNQTGPPGPAGISGYQIATTSQQTTAGGFFGTQDASCPSGKKVLGGGASATTDSAFSSGFHVLQQLPVGDSQWRAVFDIDNPLGDLVVLTTYAICANVS
jgi:hypothetical protein